MEENIKDFDRNIEHAMNEYSATPPFGMWNRISSELEAAPVVATPAVGSMFPKVAMVGLLLVAVLETAFLAGYVITRPGSEPSTITAVVPAVEQQNQQPVQTQPTGQQAVVANINQPVVVEEVAKNVKPAKRASTPEIASNDIKKIEVVTEPAMKEIATNGEVTVPQIPVTPAVNETANIPYYFPPVDIDGPANTYAQSDMSSTAPATAKANTGIAEKKVKASTSSDRKFRWKPAKRPKFHYGKLNRVK